jgi:hypothetical protein
MLAGESGRAPRRGSAALVFVIFDFLVGLELNAGDTGRIQCCDVETDFGVRPDFLASWQPEALELCGGVILPPLVLVTLRDDVVAAFMSMARVVPHREATARTTDDEDGLVLLIATGGFADEAMAAMRQVFAEVAQELDDFSRLGHLG